MIRRTGTLIALGLFSLWPCAAAVAAPDELCIFRTEQGQVRQVNGRSSVPKEQRSTARCFPAKAASERLARPDEMTIDSLKRVEQFGTSIGNVWLSWPRKVESLFGRTPLRAVTDAMNTVSRAVKNGAFPSHVQKMKADWKIIFLDENLSEQQIPTRLISGCHPGWMTPPANIYIVAQRVAEGCGGGRQRSSVADSMLARVLIHEMGHAVEYQLLKESMGMDRMRAEGFATWFEEFASSHSSVVSKRSVEQEHRTLAKLARRTVPGAFQFSGSPEDYARASLYFSAIERSRGLNGVMDVYELMGKKPVSLTEAIREELGWDEKRLEKEIEKVID